MVAAFSKWTRLREPLRSLSMELPTYPPASNERRSFSEPIPRRWRDISTFNFTRPFMLRFKVRICGNRSTSAHQEHFSTIAGGVNTHKPSNTNQPHLWKQMSLDGQKYVHANYDDVTPSGWDTAHLSQ